MYRGRRMDDFGCLFLVRTTAVGTTMITTITTAAMIPEIHQHRLREDLRGAIVEIDGSARDRTRLNRKSGFLNPSSHRQRGP